MVMKELPVKDIECDDFFKNEIMMHFWRKGLADKKDVPIPWVNEKNEVIAFHNVFFLLSEAGMEKMKVQVKKNKKETTK